MDLARLLTDLRSELGAESVSTDGSSLDRCSVDRWPLVMKWAQAGRYPYRPDAVVRVVSIDQVRTVLRSAQAAGVPVTARALGSSVTGQPLPLRGGIVLDLEGLTGSPSLDADNLVITASAGCRGSDLERYLNDRGFTLGHSPQSLSSSSVGGWVATRASGQFSSRYGSIEDLVVGFRAVLANGDYIRLQGVPRGAVGPDLRSLFIGAEGTMGIVTEVSLKVFPLAEFRRVEAFKFERVEAGIEAMRLIMRVGLRPFLLRFYDEDEARHAMLDSSFAGCVLFAGCEGIESVAAAEHDELRAIVADRGGESLASDAVDAWLQRRFDFSAVESVLATAGGYAETIEVAHSWTRIYELYQVLKTELAPYADQILGHFSHVYPQGSSLYIILTGIAADENDAAMRLEQIWEIAMTHTLRLGGELSHHHGAGLARLPYLPQALADSLPVLRRVKHALDPTDTLNPGKLALGGVNGSKTPLLDTTGSSATAR